MADNTEAEIRMEDISYSENLVIHAMYVWLTGPEASKAEWIQSGESNLIHQCRDKSLITILEPLLEKVSTFPFYN